MTGPLYPRYSDDNKKNTFNNGGHGSKKVTLYNLLYMAAPVKFKLCAEFGTMSLTCDEW